MSSTSSPDKEIISTLLVLALEPVSIDKLRAIATAIGLDNSVKRMTKRNVIEAIVLATRDDSSKTDIVLDEYMRKCMNSPIADVRQRVIAAGISEMVGKSPKSKSRMCRDLSEATSVVSTASSKRRVSQSSPAAASKRRCLSSSKEELVMAAVTAGVDLNATAKSMGLKNASALTKVDLCKVVTPDLTFECDEDSMHSVRSQAREKGYSTTGKSRKVLCDEIRSGLRGDDLPVDVQSCLNEAKDAKKLREKLTLHGVEVTRQMDVADMCEAFREARGEDETVVVLDELSLPTIRMLARRNGIAIGKKSKRELVRAIAVVSVDRVRATKCLKSSKSELQARATAANFDLTKYINEDRAGVCRELLRVEGVKGDFYCDDETRKGLLSRYPNARFSKRATKTEMCDQLKIPILGDKIRALKSCEQDVQGYIADDIVSDTCAKLVRGDETHICDCGAEIPFEAQTCGPYCAALQESIIPQQQQPQPIVIKAVQSPRTKSAKKRMSEEQLVVLSGNKLRKLPDGWRMYVWALTGTDVRATPRQLAEIQGMTGDRLSIVAKDLFGLQPIDPGMSFLDYASNVYDYLKNNDISVLGLNEEWRQIVWETRGMFEDVTLDEYMRDAILPGLDPRQVAVTLSKFYTPHKSVSRSNREILRDVYTITHGGKASSGKRAVVPTPIPRVSVSRKEIAAAKAAQAAQVSPEVAEYYQEISKISKGLAKDLKYMGLIVKESDELSSIVGMRGQMAKQAENLSTALLSLLDRFARVLALLQESVNDNISNAFIRDKILHSVLTDLYDEVALYKYEDWNQTNLADLTKALYDRFYLDFKECVEFALTNTKIPLAERHAVLLAMYNVDDLASDARFATIDDLNILRDIHAYRLTRDANVLYAVALHDAKIAISRSLKTTMQLLPGEYDSIKTGLASDIESEHEAIVQNLLVQPRKVGDKTYSQMAFNAVADIIEQNIRNHYADEVGITELTNALYNISDVRDANSPASHLAAVTIDELKALVITTIAESAARDKLKDEDVDDIYTEVDTESRSFYGELVKSAQLHLDQKKIDIHAIPLSVTLDYVDFVVSAALERVVQIPPTVKQSLLSDASALAEINLEAAKSNESLLDAINGALIVRKFVNIRTEKRLEGQQAGTSAPAVIPPPIPSPRPPPPRSPSPVALLSQEDIPIINPAAETRLMTVFQPATPTVVNQPAIVVAAPSAPSAASQSEVVEIIVPSPSSPTGSEVIEVVTVPAAEKASAAAARMFPSVQPQALPRPPTIPAASARQLFTQQTAADVRSQPVSGSQQAASARKQWFAFLP